MAEQLFEKLEIVIVTYNTPVELSMCLSSVFLFTNHSKVIIVNNGDDKLPPAVLQNEELVKKVIQGENKGFCKGLNRGVEEVDTEWFAVLPADCMLTEGWENRMKYQVATLENPGIVAPMCTSTSGPQGVETTGMKIITQRVNRIVLNGAIMRKEDFLKIGGMDEGFPNKGGNYSDDDLSRRFINAGYNNYIVNHLIFHNQSRSYGGPSEKLIEDLKIGRAYYGRKWKEAMSY